MVASNPLFQGGGRLSSVSKRFRATVINDIWPEVFFFTLVATMVSLVSQLTTHNLSISNQMLTVLGTVLGLVISFRTSTAYERFSEGRRLWTNIAIASRNLAQVIWIHAPFERVDKKTNQPLTHVRIVIEKKTMINLIQGFSVSVKHLLRGEAGVYYADLYPLISCLPRFTSPKHTTEDDIMPLWRASEMDHKMHNTIREQSFSSGTLNTVLERAQSDPTVLNEKHTSDMSESEVGWLNSLRGRTGKKFDPEKALAIIPSEHPLKPSRNPPKETIFDYFPFLRLFKLIWRRATRRFRPRPDDSAEQHRSFSGRKIRPELADSNVPLEITLFLQNYFAMLMRNAQLQPASATTMINAINSLQDTVSNLERIKNTPLPFAYQAHLRMSLWLYLFFLPFQIYTAFKFMTIPATAFASFLLLGFLEIGQEIENPFNYDLNDLDLDHFCLVIQRELHEVTAHTTPDLDEFVFSQWNQPFAPADRRTAKEMMEDLDHEYHAPEGKHNIRRTLLKSWHEVDKITRN
ncbi:Bestrophin, RFP-TM, chloride channel-domain-containing protein [Cristinia sonorae]|uniref:Bestrophin, RFP-TM, chloride channel-domain-containing protein n=1 Tax=Cristinia sonorae TaxID=1940300 RepID=A0A8K0UEX9_9AGAR|nr:Bestrophin, RFP-TM, chloride channel-domain-containing protein [Cristinia sonorae]